MNPKVDFFLVGMPRTSTTSISEYLREHPQIFMSTPKELNYFCKDIWLDYFERHRPTPYMPRTKKQYEDLFKDAHGRLRGEASVWYLPSKTSAKEIREYNPDAKIIMILREPVDWLRSTHRKYLSDLEETEEDLLSAISLEPMRKEGYNIPEKTYAQYHLQYTETAQLANHVTRFMFHFKEPQLLILLFDDVKKDMRGTMKKIYRFLEVDECFEPTLQVYNSNHDLIRPKLFKLITARPMYYFYKTFEKIMTKKAYARAKRFTFGLVHNFKPREPLSKTDEIILKRRFKQVVIELSQLIGRDLVKEWGYEEI